MSTAFEAFNEFDLQVILYSKDWYKKTEVLSDLRILIAKIAGLEPKHVVDLEILQQVAGTLHKIWNVRGPTQWDMEILYKDTWIEPLWKQKTSITLTEHIESLLRVIHMKKVDNFPKLPAPSPEYLPLKKEDTLAVWNNLNG